MADETPEEKTARLSRLVLDICDGRVFTSHQCPPEMLRLVFMPLAVAEKGQVPEDVGLVWEYMDKAARGGINGMPFFFSCHFENYEDYTRIHEGVVAEQERRKLVKV